MFFSQKKLMYYIPRYNLLGATLDSRPLAGKVVSLVYFQFNEFSLMYDPYDFVS